MANVVGRSANYGGNDYGYGNSSGDVGKYESYNNKSYSGSQPTNTYGGSGGLGHYGDYNVTKSTLDKYKDPNASKKPNSSLAN